MKKMHKQKDSAVTAKHDETFKYFLSQRDIARDFLRIFLPPAIVAHMDLQSLRIVKDSFIDKKLSKYFSDILYKVKFRDKPSLVYVLFDHKSTKDKMVPLQLLKYMVRIWEMHLKQNKNAKYLPPIIPLVVYHGEKAWGPNTNFRELFQASQDILFCIPDFEHKVSDLPQIPDEMITESISLKIVFLALKYIMDTGLKEKLPEIFDLLDHLNSKEKATEYLEVLLRYLTTSARYLEQGDLTKEVTRHFEKGDYVMQTIAQKLVRQAKKEAKRDGKREEKLETARKMKSDNMPIDTISKYTGLAIDKIKTLKV